MKWHVCFLHLLSQTVCCVYPLHIRLCRTAEEDVEARYHKVVASSLQGWKTLLTTLSNDQQEALHEKYKNILSNAKFWKLAKHQNSMVSNEITQQTRAKVVGPWSQLPKFSQKGDAIRCGWVATSGEKRYIRLYQLGRIWLDLEHF